MAGNTEKDILKEIRRLRRQNAVPLDIEVPAKSAKLDETDCPLVPPPTPSEEREEWAWPTAEGSTEDEGLIVSPLENSDSVEKVSTSSRILFTIEDNRKVAVEMFMSVLYICIREFYQIGRDKTWHAGAKGLNLRVSEWETLKMMAPKIDQIISNFRSGILSQLDLQYPLEPNYSNDTFGRKLVKMITFSKYQGVSYVSIREHIQYRIGGTKYPTRRGIHLTLTQWDKLKSLFNAIDQAVEAIDNYTVISEDDSEVAS